MLEKDRFFRSNSLKKNGKRNKYSKKGGGNTCGCSPYNPDNGIPFNNLDNFADRQKVFSYHGIERECNDIQRPYVEGGKGKKSRSNKKNKKQNGGGNKCGSSSYNHDNGIPFNNLDHFVARQKVFSYHAQDKSNNDIHGPFVEGGGKNNRSKSRSNKKSNKRSRGKKQI
jgi:hypothetical protein